MTTAAPAGRSSAVVNFIRERRGEETLNALLAGSALRRLRDERLYVALSHNSPSALLARELPALDRASARSLLSLAEAYAEVPTADLIEIGLARLAEIAAAPVAERTDLLIYAKRLPTDEVRRAVTNSRAAAEAQALREGAEPAKERDLLAGPASFADTRDEGARQRVARELVNTVRRAWTEVTSAAFAQANGIAKIRDNELFRAAEAKSPEVYLAEELGMSRSEVRRALLLTDRLGLLPVTARNAVGLGAVRAVAALDDETQRAAVIERLRHDAATLGAEGVLSLVRGLRRPAVEAESGAPAAPRHLTDDPERLAQFTALYLPDPSPSVRQFADRTEPALVEQLILRATRPGGRICDLTAGIGTVAEVAERLDRSCASLDRLDPPMAPDILVGDARTTTPPGGPFDLVVFHPPVPLEVVYSERYAGRQLAGDLSYLGPEAYARACAEVIAHARTLLVPGGMLAIVCREQRTRDELIDWPARLSVLGSRGGFRLHDRWTAVAGPDARAQRLRGAFYAARRDNVTVPVTVTALLFAQERPRRTPA